MPSTWLQRGEADRAALIAVQARSAAERDRDRAAMAETRADSELKKAQLTQSLFLADLANQKARAGDIGTGVLLALEALLPDASGTERP